MRTEYLALMAKEADQLQRHLLVVHASLRQTMITECRGPATVTMNGLGEVQSLSLTGVDEMVQDCLLAALRAAEGRAQHGYDQYGRVHG